MVCRTGRFATHNRKDRLLRSACILLIRKSKVASIRPVNVILLELLAAEKVEELIKIALPMSPKQLGNGETQPLLFAT